MKAKPKKINCSALPQVKRGWKLISHSEQGLLDLRSVKLELYKSKDSQRTGSQLLATELKNKNILNACMFDFFLKNPKEIPLDWQRLMKDGSRICFLGTKFQDTLKKYVLIRMLYMHEDKVYGGRLAITNKWNSLELIAYYNK